MTISVTAAGMVTPVGFNYASSCAAMRAGISGLRQANLWDAESGEFISAAKVDLPHWWEGLGKLVDLAAPAIHECLSVANIPPQEVPILLGVAGPDRPERLAGLDDELLNEIEFKLDLPHHRLSKTIARGNVSGVIGLQEAEAILAGRFAPACIVAGVDSFLHQNVVEAYLDQRRILTPLNSNGFLPGEAGCAVLLQRDDTQAGSRLQIRGIGMASEEAPIASDRPLMGKGITRAVSDALSGAGLTIHETSYRITDLSGEHYKFKEAMFIVGRFQRKVMRVFYDLWHHVEFIGEIGAAHACCALAWNLHAAQNGYALGPRCLLHFGSDDGERAALVTEFQPETRPQ